MPVSGVSGGRAQTIHLGAEANRAKLSKNSDSKRRIAANLITSKESHKTYVQESGNLAVENR